MEQQQSAESHLKGLFGGGQSAGTPVSPEHKAAAKDFVARYEQGDPSEGYSTDEASKYFNAALQHASPDQLQRASQKAVAKMNPDQRAAFAEMLKQRQAAGGGTVQIQHADGSRGGTQGGGLDDILGGLLGGAGGGGLGNILGGLLGGGQAGTQTGFQQGGGEGGGLGSILSSPAGKAAIAGVAAYAMKEIFDKD
jgi:hypothetical protein